VLGPLTAKLVVMPEAAWPRLTAACDANESLPAPLVHAASVAAVSVIATLVGAILIPGITVGLVIVHVLGAVGAYVGAAVISVTLAPRFVRAPATTEHLVGRFASAAVLPLVACGALNVIPIPVLSFVWALFGAALSAWSGFVGASALLGMEGTRRRDAAALIAALGIAPIVVATLLRVVLATP